MAGGSARSDHTYALTIATLVVAIAAAGFARTFYFKSYFGTPALSPIVLIHGLVMSLWCAVFMCQVVLAARGRIELHKILGISAIAIATVVVTVAGYITVEAAIREVRSRSDGDFKALLGFNLVNLVVFAGLITSGFAYRHRPSVHRRLMLLAAISLLPPAIARLEAPFMHSDTAQMLGVDALVIGCVIVDVIRHRGLHPAFLWGATATIVALHATLLLVQTSAWTRFVVMALG